MIDPGSGVLLFTELDGVVREDQLLSVSYHQSLAAGQRRTPLSYHYIVYIKQRGSYMLVAAQLNHYLLIYIYVINVAITRK